MVEIRCSSLHRPMACPGFTKFTNLPKSESGPAAEEGTACGEYLERKLTSQTEVKPGMVAKNGVAFTEDMEFYTSPIRANIYNLTSRNGVTCEQRIDWQTRSGIWIRGSYDISFISNDGALYIDDLKYGYGLVEVKENWQLIGYAVGEILRRQQTFSKIVLRIHQPRPYHEDGETREWSLTMEELGVYKEQIEARMASIVAGDVTLVTGVQCKYCPAGAYCPALNRAFNASLDVSMTFMQDVIDDKTLALQLEQAERAAELLKVRSESLKALAIDRIKGGKLIPGYVTETSLGDRRWKSAMSPAVIKAMTGKDVTEQVMLSPAKAQKLGIPKAVIDSLVDRPMLGSKLVKKDGSDLGKKIFGANPIGLQGVK